MVDISELKELEYLLTLTPNNPGLIKIFNKKSNILLENVCLEHDVCPICGKDIADIQIAIPHPETNSSSLLWKTACVDKECAYTKLVISRNIVSDAEYRLYGGKKRYLTLNDINENGEIIND